MVAAMLCIEDTWLGTVCNKNVFYPPQDLITFEMEIYIHKFQQKRIKEILSEIKTEPNGE